MGAKLWADLGDVWGRAQQLSNAITGAVADAGISPQVWDAIKWPKITGD